jgi:hypothetical protein
LAGAFGVTLLLLTANFHKKPRILTVNEVPIAFWAWRTQAPTTAEVQKAFAATNAKTLFLRAGQFDVFSGSVERIRPVSGVLPSAVELHLVYNSTRRFLHKFEELTPGTLAKMIADTYQSDFSRAQNNNADVHGIQLDFDVPGRLLPRYGEILQQLRKLLPPDTKLSITGLPTWLSTNDVNAVLANVDFWVPQCYGASIPTRITERIPISSAPDVERIVSKVRQLNKPFYAGLSAYGYALLYTKDGELSELRGDVDPALATGNAGLELIEAQAFKGNVQTGEMRYVYRAKNDLVLDSLIIQPGEMLVFDLPSAASLRAAARAVRENAGDPLLGICIFRIPAESDETALTSGEIAAALADTQTQIATAIKAKSIRDHELELHAENSGTTRAILGEDALTIDLKLPAGSINGVSTLTGFSAYETLCGGEIEILRPCSAFRANVIRLRAQSWSPGTKASITFSIKVPLPAALTAMVTTRVNDGRVERESLNFKVQSEGE